MHLNNNTQIKILITCVILLTLAACAQLPEQKPAEKQPVTQPPVEEPEKKVIKSSEEQVSMVDILLTEGLKFKSQGDYQDALIVYNQALSLADEDQMDGVLEAVELALMQAPADDIKSVLSIKNIGIPKPLLLYWYGLNAAMENNAVEAKAALTSFLFEYPDHPYAPEAAELLALINESLFKKDTIGCLLPLSGKYAIFGQRALKGIQLAIETLTKKYNTPFNLMIYDTKADPQRAVEGVRYLNEKKVAAIIGPLLTVTEAGKEAELLQIPLIGMTQKTDFSSQGDFLFSNFITPQMQVHTLGAYLFRELGVQKVAILYPDEKYGKTYMELFWDVADEYDVKVVGAEAYDGKLTDFTEPIRKLTGEFYPIPDVIKEKEKLARQAPLFFTDETLTDEMASESLEDPLLLYPAEQGQAEIIETEEEEKIEIDFEALFIPDSPSKVSLILPQLAFNDATGMYLVGTNLWHHPSLLKDAKGYNKRAVITDGFFADSQNPVTAGFTKDFEQIFNSVPKFMEAISYDCATILYTTAMDASVDTRRALKDALKDNRIYEGVTGHTIFDREGQASRPLFLVTIKRGKFVEISH